ncbi:metallophosphoesterase family protein [Sporofaciens musculi]|uniref:metallophosphoesterase family protein n=1 Tax=Sporofaciens musculi TaxID=2681861 RepID=UPI0025703548|nr:YfcE family phosphodiesterase [Sporofaciens musculi]
MKVLVISDTHGLLRSEVKEMLGNCDAVIHSGDFHTQEVYNEIRNAVQPDTPVFMVRGNNDGRWAAHLPAHLEFTLDSVKFYVVHDKKELPENLHDVQIVIFGHSHRYTEERKDGRFYLNSGSCGRRRFRLDLTMAVLHLENGNISVDRLELSHEDVKAAKMSPSQDNLSGVIQDIMKRMDKGQHIRKISSELKLDYDFVEEICRIRVTHPGVTSDGLMDKIEVNEIQRK